MTGTRSHVHRRLATTMGRHWSRLVVAVLVSIAVVSGTATASADDSWPSIELTPEMVFANSATQTIVVTGHDTNFQQGVTTVGVHSFKYNEKTGKFTTKELRGTVVDTVSVTDAGLLTFDLLPGLPPAWWFVQVRTGPYESAGAFVVINW